MDLEKVTILLLDMPEEDGSEGGMSTGILFLLAALDTYKLE